MRIVDWNIEHMNSWFVPNNDSSAPALRDGYTGRRAGGPIDDVPALAQRVATVLKNLDPDVICIQEGASEQEVALFLNHFLPLDGSEWTVFGGAGGAQKLITAVRTDRNVVTGTAVGDDSDLGVPLDAEYPADTNGDGVLETDSRFTRVPLVIDVAAHGQNVRVINCHLKSKFVPNGEDLFTGSQAEQREFIRAALVNRRRISAEAFRIRTYLDALFEADADRLILVAGDLNDGPGFDLGSIGVSGS